MGMDPSQASGASGSPADPPVSMHPGGHAPPRGIVLAALVGLTLYVGTQAHALWNEWRSLRAELDQAQNGAVIDYPNIRAAYSLAARPAAWCRTEGDALVLWGGWDKRLGHTWFRAVPADFKRGRIGEPAGRDVLHPIDRPLVEIGGGRIWERLPAGAPVAGCILEGADCAYPVPLLAKVGVVNDRVEGHPYVVLFDPSGARGRAVSIFDARVDDRPVSFGNSGYRLDGRIVLYDRESEGLWVEDAGALGAISGQHKGRRLPLVDRPTPAPWGAWRAQHPACRLLIGEKLATEGHLASK